MTFTNQYYMLPPGNKATTTTVVNGRSYTCALGSVLTNVPYQDADELEANGWIKSYEGGSGTTAQRPNATTGIIPLPPICRFYDTTVVGDIVWDGVNWRNPVTGATI